MKKLLWPVLGVFLLAGIHAFAAGKMSQADLEDLKGRLQQDTNLLARAADEQNLKKVVSIGNRVVAEAKQLKAHAPGNWDRVAIINGEPTPGYLLFQAEPAEEFVLIAQVMLGKMHLADVLNQHSDLLQGAGFLSWITGNAQQMSVHMAPMAEPFRTWKRCEEELKFAQEQGLYVRPASEVCVAEE